MVPIDPWQNSTPFYGARKIDNFSDDLKMKMTKNMKTIRNLNNLKNKYAPKIKRHINICIKKARQVFLVIFLWNMKNAYLHWKEPNLVFYSSGKDLVWDLFM